MPKNPAEILDFQFQYTRNMEKVTRNDKKYQYIPLIDKFCSSGVEFNLSKWNLLFQSTPVFSCLLFNLPNVKYA